MDAWVKFVSAQIQRPRTKSLLTIGLVLIAIAIIVGIADNPPGIILAYLGSFFLVLSFVHHWREAVAYGTLLAVSVVSFPVLVLLHNIFDTLITEMGGVPVLDQLLFGFSVIFFLAAIFLSPVGIAIGIILGLYYLIRK